jgi:hypothetical protein
VIEDSKLQVPGEFYVINWQIPEVRGDWSAFDFPDPDDERIAALREEFAIEEAVEGADGDLAQILALKRWVRSRWDHGWSFAHRTVEDALDIMREAAEGHQFNCGHYSTVFVACATALGIPARRIGLGLANCSFPRGHDVGNIGHCVAEAWCNEIGAWMVVDCDLNLHYERDGVPVRAMDVHDAWLSGDREALTPVYDDPPFVVPGGQTVEILGELFPECRGFDDEAVALKFARFGRNDVMDYYARLRFYAQPTREWLDPRLPPTFVRHFKPAPAVRYTQSEAEVYPTLNAVRIGTEADWTGGGASLTVALEHGMPWFAGYEARIDGGPWTECDASFTWAMREGANRLEVRAINRRDRRGPTSSLEVAYAAPVW